MADWLAVKLNEKGMAPYQLAEKMGIAAGVVKAWKQGSVQPKAHHIRSMVAILGTYRPANAKLLMSTL